MFLSWSHSFVLEKVKVSSSKPLVIKLIVEVLTNFNIIKVKTRKRFIKKTLIKHFHQNIDVKRDEDK